MRLSPPSLLIAAVLSTVAACKLNSAGLGAGDVGHVTISPPDGGSAGNGAAGAISPMGTAGAGDAGGAGGSSGGDGVMGTAGDLGTAGDGLDAASGTSGGDAATDADAAGALDVADAATDAAEAHLISAAGCADGTREGLNELTEFPDVAACSGGWSVPGFLAPATLTPQCGRAAGNDGDRPDGDGCSVADLCAEGWHVCESAKEFAMKATNCDLAFPGGAVKMFFATRQRGPVSTCDPANAMGSNNIYGCGNFGSNAPAACAPFMRTLHDTDCKANPPWMCGTTSNDAELEDVTKPGSVHGGVLCCR